MKEKIKKSWNFCGGYYVATMETCCVISKKILRKKIQMSEKLNKIY